MKHEALCLHPVVDSAWQPFVDGYELSGSR